MKTAANCESQCKMHYLLNRSSTCRTHMAAHYVGHACPRVGYTSARARTVSTERRRAAVSRWRTNPPPRRTAPRRPWVGGIAIRGSSPAAGCLVTRESPRSASLQRAASSGRVVGGALRSRGRLGPPGLRARLPSRYGTVASPKASVPAPTVGPHSVSVSARPSPWCAGAFGPSVEPQPPEEETAAQREPAGRHFRGTRSARPECGRRTGAGPRGAARTYHSDLGSGEITR